MIGVIFQLLRLKGQRPVIGRACKDEVSNVIKIKSDITTALNGKCMWFDVK